MSGSKEGRKKGFANHFVLLLQFHESRNAAERKKQGVGGGGEESKDGERERKRGRECVKLERERETVSGISRSWK